MKVNLHSIIFIRLFIYYYNYKIHHFMIDISNSSDFHLQSSKMKTLLSQIQLSPWKQSIFRAHKFMNIKLYNLQKLTPAKVSQLYQSLLNKFYKEEKSKNCWYQNELRIFVWLLVAYSNMKDRLPQEFDNQEWEYLSSVFQNKTIQICQYQYYSIKKVTQKLNPWLPQQDELLLKIIKQKEIKNKWNEVAKHIFIDSNQKYFRTAKQCRERWNNYLDPAKVKGRWTNQQDLILIRSVIKKGKKWSMIAKQLNNRRTQHTVKNRFKSLLVKQCKKDKLKQRKNFSINEMQILMNIQKKLIQNNEDEKDIQQQQESQIIKKQQFVSQNNQKIQKNSIPQFGSYTSAFSKIDKPIDIHHQSHRNQSPSNQSKQIHFHQNKQSNRLIQQPHQLQHNLVAYSNQSFQQPYFIYPSLIFTPYIENPFVSISLLRSDPLIGISSINQLCDQNKDEQKNKFNQKN